MRWLRDQVVLFDIRLPRMLMGVLIGAGLAVSGAVLQGLFRNPLADPGLVGVSSGAGLGAVLFIVMGDMLFAPLIKLLGTYALPIAAFIGGLATTTLLYGIATRRGQTAIATLLLSGIALGAVAGAVTGLLVYAANDTQLRDLTFWGLGSLAGSNWVRVASAGPIILVALAAAPMLAVGLNAMTLGEATAHHLGIPVQRLKTIAIVAVAASTGASVAASGGIGFVASWCRICCGSVSAPTTVSCCRVRRCSVRRSCSSPTASAVRWWRRRNCRSASSPRRWAGRSSCGYCCAAAARWAGRRCSRRTRSALPSMAAGSSTMWILPRRRAR